MKTFICLVLLIISISYANTQEPATEQNNTRGAFYLHPFSTYSGMAGFNPIYFTVEIPFSLSNSLIIRPSYLNWSRVNDKIKAKAFRLGSDIGIRRYLAGKGEGLYLQGQMGIFYYNHSFEEECDELICVNLCPFCVIDIPQKSIWLDAMGYIGYSFKFLFIDIGIGLVLGISTENGHVKLLDTLWPDLNIGIGILF
ncbi:MAG: hypothetical protein LBC87_10820 [Fibromonadaceae bacterium]|jgi:hypothetical protein|nr:hypothetical protein [Fibromonadaceae bacterium]